MNYGRINPNDIAHGTGVRVTLFVSGCTHHCKGCFNPETWDFDAGKVFDAATEVEILGMLGRSYITGFTLLGGEPMEQSNRAVLLPFLKKVRERYPELSIWCYSGYTFEELTAAGASDILQYIDVLVDGEFVLEKKDIRLPFRGSSNQRILDMKKSLEDNAPILYELTSMN